MRASFPAAAAVAALSAILTASCSDAPTASLRPAASSAILNRATPTYAFTTIDVAGASLTQPQGINAAGNIVGWYTLGGLTHGFLLTSDDTTTIDHLDANGQPDAHYTDLRGIAPNGDIVGNYAKSGEEAVAYHGFRRTAAGQFTDQHYPGHLFEIIQRILPDGSVLGCRHDHDLGASMRGIVMTGTDTTEVAVPISMNNGATPDLSRIAGQHTNTGNGHIEGYTIDDGVYNPFVVAADALSTVPWDVSPRGDVVGVYRDHAGAYHGFVRTEAGFTIVDASITGVTVTATRIFGTNARGDLVGTYIAGGVTHGFLARRQ